MSDQTKPLTVIPFSNGTEYQMWQERNCDRCQKFDLDVTTTCELDRAISAAAIGDGTIPRDLAIRAGYRDGVPHMVRCTEFVERPKPQPLPAPRDVPTWLRMLCADLPGGGRHEWRREPFHANGWTVATDGQALVAIDDLIAGFEASRAEIAVRDYLNRQPDTVETIPIGILRRLLGQAKWLPPDHEDYFAGPRVVRWLGRLIDADLLARYTAMVPGEDDAVVRLGWHGTPKAFYLDGQGWRVVLGSLEPQPNPPQLYPLLGVDYFRDCPPHLRAVARRAVEDGSLAVLADAVEESGYEPLAVAHLRSEHAGASWVAVAIGEGE